MADSTNFDERWPARLSDCRCLHVEITGLHSLLTYKNVCHLVIFFYNGRYVEMVVNTRSPWFHLLFCFLISLVSAKEGMTTYKEHLHLMLLWFYIICQILTSCHLVLLMMAGGKIPRSWQPEYLPMTMLLSLPVTIICADPWNMEVWNWLRVGIHDVVSGNSREYSHWVPKILCFYIVGWGAW
jgi:hypothetical protein